MLYIGTMKKYALVTALLVAVFSGTANAATWVETGVEDWQFDIATVETLQNGTIRVWNRSKLRPQVVETLSNDLRKNGTPMDYSKYAFSTDLWELNCKKRMYRPITGTNYSSNGIVIYSYDVEATQPLQRVTPDSDGETVFNAICKLVRKK